MTNYYVMSGGSIVQAADFKFLPCCLETEENIVRGDDGKLYFESEWAQIKQSDEYKAAKLLQLKEQKLKENLDKAYFAEQNGLIQYNDALIETSTSNVAKLTSQFAMLSAGMVETVQWLSKDDIQLELTAQDLTAIGVQIAEYTSALWNVHYLAFKEAIEACESAEAVDAIVIDYINTPEAEPGI